MHKACMNAIKTLHSQTSLLVAFVSDSGLDASPPASTHELTIPNDVSKSLVVVATTFALL